MEGIIKIKILLYLVLDPAVHLDVDQNDALHCQNGMHLPVSSVLGICNLKNKISFYKKLGMLLR